MDATESGDCPSDSYVSTEQSDSSDSTEREINIYLKVMKTVAFKVKSTETIKNLKAMFREKEGVSEILQELFFAGHRLKDGQALVDYGIEDGSTLNLFLQNSDEMKIYVKIPSNQRTIVVEVKFQDTIESIKSVLQVKEGIRPDQYTLMHAGKLLEDSRTFASLNIQRESTLYLVFDPSYVLPIFVKTPNKETVKLEVKLLYTVRDVKAIVGSMMNFPIKDQFLFYAGKQLDDCRSLAHYSIKEDSVLEILPATIQIFVRTWTGKTITLGVLPSDTASDVNDRIYQKLGLPFCYHSLFLGGKRLEEGRDLATYNIQRDTTLHMGRPLVSSSPDATAC